MQQSAHAVRSRARVQGALESTLQAAERRASFLALGKLSGEHTLSAFDAVFAQGQPAAGVADFAERLGVPVVRFVESGEALNVLLERPAVLVFPSAAALRASGDLVEEALRLVLPPELAHDAEHAAYALIEGRLRALASARASLPDTLVWDPDGLGKVSVVTINQCMQVWFERPAGP